MDSRFHLKVEFVIYGQTYKWEPSLNYFDRGDGMDDRISEWFISCYNKAYEKYQEENNQAARERENKSLELAELTELARLRAKYPGHE